MSPRLALIALITLPLAACEGIELPGVTPQQETPQVEGHQGPPSVSPLVAPIETGGEGAAVATAEARTHSTAAFSARGTEPFWAVDVAGNTALYKTPDNQKGRAVRVDRLTFAGGVEYIGVLNGRPFTLTVRGTDCQDGMSDEKYPMSAQLRTSGRTLNGCALPAVAEVAQAVAAIRAPAPTPPKPAATPATASRSAAPAARPADTAATTPTATPATSSPAPTPAAPAAASSTPTPEPAPADAPTTGQPPAPDTPAATTTTPEAETPAPAAPATTAPPASTETSEPQASGRIEIPATTLTLPAVPPAIGTDSTSEDGADGE